MSKKKQTPRSSPAFAASRDVTDAELAVLEVLWEVEEASVREIADRLYPGGKGGQSATVQKLLERLEAKGWVERQRRQRPQLFRARGDRDALIDRRLTDTAEQLCGGSIAPLLSCLVRGRKLSRAERESLRELIEQLGSNRGRKRGRPE